MVTENYDARVEIGGSVHEGTLSFKDGKISGSLDGHAVTGIYDLDGESLAAEFHGKDRDDGPGLFGPDGSSATLSGVHSDGTTHLTGTTGHEAGINVKATLTRQS